MIQGNGHLFYILGGTRQDSGLPSDMLVGG